jgi:hypothetical protein
VTPGHAVDSNRRLIPPPVTVTGYYYYYPYILLTGEKVGFYEPLRLGL